MNITDEISTQVSKNYDDFLKECLKEHGIDFKNPSELANRGLCVEQGNDKHFFIDGKYIFSIRHSMDYPQDGNTFKCNMNIKSYFDESMIDYKVDESEANQ